MLTDIRALADHFLIALPNINTCNIELNSSNLEFCKIQAWGSTSHENILCHVAMLVVPTVETCLIC